MQLILVRHGLPHASEGTVDAPLSAAGHRQAAAASDYLAQENVRHIVSSPMQRARQTAEPLAAALGLSVEVDDDLSEYDAGRTSYTPVHLVRHTNPEVWRQMQAGELPDFVDRDAFRQRVMGVIERLVGQHEGRQSIAVFCHSGVINAVLVEYLQGALSLPFPVDYAGLSRVIASRSGRRVVLSVNETSHVRHLLADGL